MPYQVPYLLAWIWLHRPMSISAELSNNGVCWSIRAEIPRIRTSVSLRPTRNSLETSKLWRPRNQRRARKTHVSPWCVAENKRPNDWLKIIIILIRGIMAWCHSKICNQSSFFCYSNLALLAIKLSKSFFISLLLLSTLSSFLRFSSMRVCVSFFSFGDDFWKYDILDPFIELSGDFLLDYYYFYS